MRKIVMKFKGNKELAQFLGVSDSGVSRWITAGLPYKIGPKMKYEFDLESVLDWLIKKSPRHKRFVQQLLAKWERASHE